jgi:flavin reductase (DIM6/NTAB) family NADH-FMN oxidoreductase RutF
MVIDPASLERGDLNALATGLVYPRPIAWVSTVAADGRRNLAPFSFFNAFCFHPAPIVAIGPGSRSGSAGQATRADAVRVAFAFVTWAAVSRPGT